MPKQPAKSKPVKAVAPNRPKRPAKPTKVVYPDYDATFRPEDAIVAEGPAVLQPSKLAYRDDARGLWLYHGDCLEVMDTLLAKYPHGMFDLIFADPPVLLDRWCILPAFTSVNTSLGEEPSHKLFEFCTDFGR